MPRKLDLLGMSHLLQQVGVRVGEFLEKKLSVSDETRQGLVSDLLEAASRHGYIETFGNRADTWHRALKFTSSDEWFEAFNEFVASRLPRRLQGPIWLAIDVTEEAYYGHPTLQTRPWTKEKGITAWWDFMVVSVVESSTGKTFPLAALPFPLGASKGRAVERLLDAAITMLPRIDLVLFDRGFYSGEVIQVLENKNLQYLMLVAKNALVRPLADQCRCTGRWAVISHTIEWKADKSSQSVETNLVIFPDKKYDWSWATNLVPYHVSRLICKYRMRWRIETMFRVQDTARLKTKSRRGIVRYVTFLISLLLTALWALASAGKTFQRWLADLTRLVWLTCAGITTSEYWLV